MIVAESLPDIAVRPQKRSTTVNHIRAMKEARRLQQEWAELWLRAQTSNPFTHPAWLLAWAERFVPDGELEIVAVHENGVLTAVVPLWRWNRRSVGLTVRTLQPLGTGPHCSLTEMPGILTARGVGRRQIREAIGSLAQFVPDWDWSEITLSQDQGWFEPEWMARPGRSAGPVLHKVARPFVILDIRDGVTPRKRNLRESLRRARNRLNRSSLPWHIEVATESSQVGKAVLTTIDLHKRRAAMPDRLGHPDYFSDPADVSFALEAVSAMAGLGLAEARILHIDDTPVAGIVALRAHKSTFISFSGMDEAAWGYSPTTLLLSEVVEGAVALGHETVNLSSGASVAKLRWSEELEIHHDFVVPTRSWRARTKLAAFLGARSVYGLHRELRRVEVRK